MSDRVDEASRRVVLLGASNLSQGLATVLETARHLWNDRLDLLVADGRGRSYGWPSRLLGRGLSSIIDCGIWRELAARPRRPTAALVTDVGNDVMYGAAPAQILAWVEECVARIARHDDARIVITGLPIARVSQLPPRQFLMLRSVLFPRNRDDFATILGRSREVDLGLRRLAERYGAAFVEPRLEWYGFDPIHLRPAVRGAAWREVLSGWRPSPHDRAMRRVSFWYSMRTQLWAPEERSWFGVPRRRPAINFRLADDARLSLF